MESVKYTFDNDFSGDSSGHTYSGKMQKIQDEAFEEGKIQGAADAQQSIEKNCEMILENVRNALDTVMARHDEQIISMEKNATILVMAIVRKLAPAIIEETPLKEIESLVQECMRNNPLEPRIVVRLDEQILPLLRRKIDTLQTTCDYHGQIVLISEPMTNISDCRVEWIDGGAERDFEELMKSIEDTVNMYLESPPQNENQENENVGAILEPNEQPEN